MALHLLTWAIIRLNHACVENRDVVQTFDLDTQCTLRLLPLAYGLGTSNHKTIDIFILTLDPTCMNRLHFFSINTRAKQDIRAKQMDTRKCYDRIYEEG